MGLPDEERGPVGAGEMRQEEAVFRPVQRVGRPGGAKGRPGGLRRFSGAPGASGAAWGYLSLDGTPAGSSRRVRRSEQVEGAAATVVVDAAGDVVQVLLGRFVGGINRVEEGARDVGVKRFPEEAHRGRDGVRGEPGYDGRELGGLEMRTEDGGRHQGVEVKRKERAGVARGSGGSGGCRRMRLFVLVDGQGGKGQTLRQGANGAGREAGVEVGAPPADGVLGMFARRVVGGVGAVRRARGRARRGVSPRGRARATGAGGARNGGAGRAEWRRRYPAGVGVGVVRAPGRW